MVRRNSQTIDRIETAHYARTERVQPMSQARVGCVRDCPPNSGRDCHPTRDRMMERRDVGVCLPSPRTADLPRFQPKLDLQFDPNPFRGNCDVRAIRLDDRPAKIALSDPPPLVSLFPQQLRLEAPANFFAECPPARPTTDDEDCGPEVPRRPLSPDGFKYPNLLVTGETAVRSNFMATMTMHRGAAPQTGNP